MIPYYLTLDWAIETELNLKSVAIGICANEVDNAYIKVYLNF